MTLSRRSFLKGAGAILPLAAQTGVFATQKVEPLAGAGVLERFKSTQRYDSTYHQQQHGLQ